MEKNYAQALWQMIENGMAPAKAVHALRETLVAHGREALFPRIGYEFGRIAQREQNKNGVTLSVAREKDAVAGKRATKEALEGLGVKGSEVLVQVDESLIGGWRLEGREHLVDASFKKYLLEMYNRATA